MRLDKIWCSCCEEYVTPVNCFGYPDDTGDEIYCSECDNLLQWSILDDYVIPKNYHKRRRYGKRYHD